MALLGGNHRPALHISRFLLMTFVALNKKSVFILLNAGNVKPFGVWLHYRASYSARGFASQHCDGTKSVMLVRTATGTHGQDDGTGRRARKIAGSSGVRNSSGELADCHVFSIDDYRRDGRVVVYNGSQCMPGYVVYFT